MPQTLLLVDDSLTIQRVIQLTFADQDIQVVTASTVDQALDAVSKTPPDIVLADVGMPGQNGLDLARQLRRMPAVAQVPLLLLTGAFEPVDPEQARAVGASGVLVKPFEPAVVVGRVRELLASALAANAPAPFRAAANAEPSSPWASDIVSPPLRAVEPPAPRTEKVARLDDYFARLDEAISTRAAEAYAPRLVSANGADERSGSPPDEAPSVGEGPALSGAFSALLAAEQRGSAADAFDGWLPPAASAPPAVLTPDNVSEDLVAAIVNLVLDRLPDTVVRETVSAIANATAERVIREEIDRIKKDIT